MKEERTRNILLVIGTIVIVIFLVFFIRKQVWPGEEVSAKKELWPDALDPARSVYRDESGVRVIQWEKIQVTAGQ